MQATDGRRGTAALVSGTAGSRNEGKVRAAIAQGEQTNVPARISCEVCGGEARHRLTQTAERHIDFYLCENCGLLFAGTDISDKELASFYARMDTGSYYESVAETSRAKADRAVADLMAVLPVSAQLIDLGCGGGHMLRAVNENNRSWSAVGHDFDADSVELCRASGMTATSNMESLRPADAVTMLDVAEHVRDPVGLFRQAHDLLRSNGVLYLHTPRRCVWDTAALAMLRVPGLRKLGTMWLRTRVSVFHLRLWTDDALRQIVQDSGFRLERYSSELELSWPVERYITLYVQQKFRAPAAAVVVAQQSAQLVVRFKLLRNKAILTARRL